MQYLIDLLSDFRNRLDDIATIDSLNDDLLKIYRKSLDEIKSEIEGSQRFGGLLIKVVQKIDNISSIEKLPDLKAKYAILREQSVVLIIGSFEVFMSDIFRNIAENDPDYFRWKDENEKISIDPSVFSVGFTLGDAILAHLKNKKYSFQDLKSILKAVDNYVGVKLTLEESDPIRQQIVLGTAIRHIVVHNRSIIDKQFLSQVKAVPDLSYAEGGRIDLSQSDVDNVKKAVNDFSEILVNLIIQREDIDDDPI